MRITQLIVAMCRAAAIGVALGVSVPAISQSGDIEKLSKSQEWLKLLHYKKGLFSGYQSEISNPDFFLSPTGQKDPAKELEANFQAFMSGRKTADGSTLAACAFPLRFKFLKSEIAADWPEVSCPEFEAWRKQLSADSVTLIFSGYFQGTPASMFGHTFLRLNRTQEGSFLDLAIDYSALVGTDPAPLQVPRGLFGSYVGAFTAWPYYVKVKEYNNAENRDLFEYDLSFRPEEVERLIAHLYELGRAKMNYYFIKRNCSYEILALLQAAKPEWNLTENFPVHAIPIDTVRAVLRQPNSLRSVHIRPSLKRRLSSKWAALSTDSKNEYFGVIENQMKPQEIMDPLLAEALGLHFAIRQIEGRGSLAASEAKVFHQINLRRSLLPAAETQMSATTELPRPDLTHRSQRMSFGAGTNEAGSAFFEPGWRVALHELTERDAGYAPDSTLEFLKIRARLQREKAKANLQANIEEVTFINLLALNSMGRLGRPASFELSAGLINPTADSCNNCLAGHIRAGTGGSVDFSPKTKTYLLAAVQSDIGGMFERSFRYGAGLRAGLIFRPLDRYKIVADANWLRFFNQRREPEVLQLELNQGWAWRNGSETHFRLQSAAKDTEAVLMQHFYF